MNIVAHNHQSSELLSSKFSYFLDEFHVERILKTCNAYKVRGFSVKDVFQVSFENMLVNKSLSSLLQVKDIGYDVIGIVKKSDKIHFRYNGRM